MRACQGCFNIDSHSCRPHSLRGEASRSPREDLYSCARVCGPRSRLPTDNTCHQLVVRHTACTSASKGPGIGDVTPTHKVEESLDHACAALGRCINEPVPKYIRRGGGWRRAAHSVPGLARHSQSFRQRQAPGFGTRSTRNHFVGKEAHPCCGASGLHPCEGLLQLSSSACRASAMF